MPFQKGHKLATGRPKGSLNRTTLIKEERRAIFDKIVSQDWEKTIAQLPPTYKADQFLGKAPEEHTVNIKTKEPLPSEKIEAIDKIMFEDDKG